MDRVISREITAENREEVTAAKTTIVLLLQAGELAVVKRGDSNV